MKRAVLVGCGVMGERWAETAVGPLANRIDLVGLVDTDIDAAERVRGRHGTPHTQVFGDLEQALSELKPDVVFDVAVPSVRKNIVLSALQHGCDVLTEKPMALSMEDARTMLAEANKSGVVYAITQNRRFKRNIRRIRQFLETGVLGKISALHCDFFIGAHFGGFRDRMEHVLLLDMAIHTFDAARFMSGKDPRAVFCVENNPSGSWYAHGAAANAIFELSDDVVFTYRGSWCAEGANTSWEAAWRIVGSNGTLLWDGEDRVSAKVVNGNEGFFRPLKEVAVPAWTETGTVKEHESVIADFLDAVETGGRPECPGSDNIKSLAMVFGAIDSARTQRRVEVNP